MKNWFSSDYHFDHVNILKYDKRPFDNIEEMNNTIIKNHNSIVSSNDNFYFLGDFSFAKDKNRIEEHIKQLNGNKFFIKGNHDHRNIIDLYKKYGTYLGHMAEIKVDNQFITLNHYAMRVWNRSHHGTYHIFGHSHGSLLDDINSLSFDVGINCHNYYPIEFEEVIQIMNKKNFKSIDHHV